MPQVARRRSMVTLVLMFVAVGALAVGVWLVGDQANRNLRRETEDAARQQNTSLREGCARAVARDFESYGTNRDLAGYANDAARVWARQGRPDVARKYAARARSAELRMERIKVRLPANADGATIAAFCRGLYPG